MTPGKAVAFLLLGLLNTYLALWLLGYAAYWFLLVLDGTAEGQDVVKVHWPDETFRERLWKLGHLTFICLIWLLPTLAFFHYTELPVSAELRPPLIVMITGIVIWLLLPISLLSSMTSESHWEIFRWTVLRRLFERFRTWREFYGYTFPLLIGCSLVAYLALFGWEALKEEAEGSSITWLADALVLWSWAVVLPLTAVMAATALLIYARLLGRLAWMMDFWDEEEEERQPAEPAAPAQGLLAVHDNLEAAEPVAVAPAGLIPFADDTEPIAAIPVLREPQVIEASPPQPENVAVETPRPTRRLWVRGIYLFPWYRSSLLAWLSLTLGGLVLGALLRFQLHLRS